MLPHAPGVQVQAIPEDSIKMDVDDQDGAADGDTEAEKDERLTQSDKDKRIAPDNEFSDSEDEGPQGDGRKNRESHKNPRKKLRTEGKTDGSASPTTNEGTSPVKDEKPAEEKVAETKTETPAVTEKKEENGTTVTKKEESNEPAAPTPAAET
jgi:histone deacetylase 1/2